METEVGQLPQKATNGFPKDVVLNGSCVSALELHFTHSMYDSWDFFGADVEKFFTRILKESTETCQFDPITLHLDHSNEMKSIDKVCQSLSQQPECLSKTTQFKIYHSRKRPVNHFHEKLESINIYDDQPPLPPSVYEVLEKCALRVLHFKNVLPQLSTLGASLTGKGLTEICLQGINLDVEHLEELFLPLKPNTLKTVKLNVELVGEDLDSWSLAAFLKKMSEGPWTALETLHYYLGARITRPDFSLMAQFPKLFPKMRSCLAHSSLTFLPHFWDFTQCINQFFKTSKQSLPAPRALTFGQHVTQCWPACALVDLMLMFTQQSQNHSCHFVACEAEDIEGANPTHPIRLNFDVVFSTCDKLTSFTLANVHIVKCGYGFYSHGHDGPNIIDPFGGRMLEDMVFPPPHPDRRARRAEFEQATPPPGYAPVQNQVNVQEANPQVNVVPVAPAVDPAPAPAPAHPAFVVVDNPCAICRRYYGNTLMKIFQMVNHGQGGQLDDYFLNPCKADRVVDDLSREFPDVDVALIPDQVDHSYTIDVGELQITIGAQPCILPGCGTCNVF